MRNLIKNILLFSCLFLIINICVLCVVEALPIGGPGNNNGEVIFGHHHFYSDARVHENTDTFTIDETNTWHLLYDDAWVAGSNLNGMTVGAAATGAITAYSDAGGGLVQATSVGHGLLVGTAVSITGSTDYDGVWEVIGVPTADTFTFTDTWTEDTAAGTFNRSACLIATYSGKYFVGYSITLKPGAVNDEYAASLYNGFTAGASDRIDGTENHTTFSLTTKFDEIMGFAIVSLTAGDSIVLGFKNLSGSDDPVVRYMEIFAFQL